MDERLERLINRKLDGELTEDESLELDKLLIRDPQARECLEHSLHIDGLAASYIEGVCAGPMQDKAAVEPSKARHAVSEWRRWLPMAAAACLLLFVTWQSVTRNADDAGPESVPIVDRRAPTEIDRPTIQPEIDPTFASWPARKSGSVPARQVDRTSTYYGFYDNKTGKTYLLELRRTGQADRNRLQQPTLSRDEMMRTSSDM